MYWLVLTRGSGHFDCNDAAAVYDKFADVRVGQQIDTDLLQIVDGVEQIGDDAVGIFYPSYCEAPVFFTQPEYNQASVRIGKGTISGPKILRKPAFPIHAGCQFALHARSPGCFSALSAGPACDAMRMASRLRCDGKRA